MSSEKEHILITGASQGIGEAIARTFSTALPGATLSLLARNTERLQTVADACNKEGADAHIYPCDLTNPDAVKKTCDELLSESGTPTALINNAGTFQPGGISDTTIEQYRFQMDVNLTSAFLISSQIVPEMISAGSGHVIFMASVASMRGYPRGIAYCASKHGLLGLARAIREETKEDGVRVTAILPGATRTASWDGSGFPDERLMPPEDIAAAVLAAYQMSERTVVEEILLRPQLGDI
ncbi:MAG: SDR family NAD(P)-dependent oxidoreductase [Bacteroidetes bacterium]|nr:SDR family NAD(P)-dependent oxidoreductase [Bacteroidota bacterium]